MEFVEVKVVPEPQKPEQEKPRVDGVFLGVEAVSNCT